MIGCIAILGKNVSGLRIQYLRIGKDVIQAPRKVEEAAEDGPRPGRFVARHRESIGEASVPQELTCFVTPTASFVEIAKE